MQHVIVLRSHGMLFPQTGTPEDEPVLVPPLVPLPLLVLLVPLPLLVLLVPLPLLEPEEASSPGIAS
jgi:hypothetical protein